MEVNESTAQGQWTAPVKQRSAGCQATFVAHKLCGGSCHVWKIQNVHIYVNFHAVQKNPAIFIYLRCLRIWYSGPGKKNVCLINQNEYMPWNQVLYPYLYGWDS